MDSDSPRKLEETGFSNEEGAEEISLACSSASTTEEGSLDVPPQVHEAMKITPEDALSLLSKYAMERTHVLAVFVTPSASVARVAGTIRIFTGDQVPLHLIVGEEDGTPDQIKFRLSDCVFQYGDFRDAGAEDFGAHKFEGFLVVGSKNGDTLSLFEPKS